MASRVPGTFHSILSCIHRSKTYVKLQGYVPFTLEYRMLCTWERSIKVKDCYLILGVDWSATVIDVREAYLKLAKLYHPDCGRSTADATKFSKIEQAYRVVMDHVTRTSQNGSEVSDQEFEKEIFDIHHTAPQHRQYLEYGGIGFGSPSKRQKQYQQHRVQRASDKVIDHKYGHLGEQETSIAEPEKRAIRRSKHSKVIDRLVEDLIQEAMSKGEFKNLVGSGKPLKLEQDVYVDSTTRRLNKVLIDSGFAPEWIALEKEIRLDIERHRENLLQKRKKLGPSPLTLLSTNKWERHLKVFHDKLRDTNKKIDRFNMIVPILNKQKVHTNFQKEVDRVVKNYGYGIMESNVEDPWKNAGGEKRSDKPRRFAWNFLQRLLGNYKVGFLERLTESQKTMK